MIYLFYSCNPSSKLQLKIVNLKPNDVMDKYYFLWNAFYIFFASVFRRGEKKHNNTKKTRCCKTNSNYLESKEIIMVK